VKVLETAARVSEEAKSPRQEPLEPEPEAQAADAEPSPKAPAQESVDLLSPELLSLLRKVIPTLWLMAAVVAGFMSGPPLLLLVLAAGVLALIVTLLWSSVQSLTGGAALGFEEALGMGARSRVEEEKRAVLRALKDLEYERSVGKISPEDYAELSAKYRAEAKRLMQSLDEALGPARAEVEKAIGERLERAGVERPAEVSAKTPLAEKSDETPAEEPEEDAPESAKDAQPEPPKEAP
jgi:hypothetical protein